MKKFIWRRLLLLLPTLFGALSLVFLLVHLIPGDPVEVMLGETASGADKQELRRALGLDQAPGDAIPNLSHQTRRRRSRLLAV